MLPGNIAVVMSLSPVQVTACVGERYEIGLFWPDGA